jgi:hypothetical protein
MKSSISRSAAWLFTTPEENPEEVVAALDDKTEAVIRELEAQHDVSRFAPRRARNLLSRDTSRCGIKAVLLRIQTKQLSYSRETYVCTGDQQLKEFQATPDAKIQAADANWSVFNTPQNPGFDRPYFGVQNP